MSGPGLITSYLDTLARQLPGQVVEELAAGHRLDPRCRAEGQHEVRTGPRG